MKNKELSILEQQEISEVLFRLGLQKKEQLIYITLLSSGISTVTPIARILHLPVTTVQSIFSRLHDRGFIYISKQKTRNVYQALPPKLLNKMLEDQIQEVKRIVPLLESMEAFDNNNVGVRVYYRERMADIFHRALRAEGKLVYEIVAAKELQEVLGEKFHFSRRRVDKGVRLKSLRVEAREIKKYSKHTHRQELREAKFLPRDFTFQSSVLFWDNTVAFISTKNEGISVVIESASLCTMMKQIFELLWGVSRPMETLKE